MRSPLKWLSLTSPTADATTLKGARIADQLSDLSTLIAVHPELADSFRRGGPLDRMCLYVGTRAEVEAFRVAAGDAEVAVVDGGEDERHEGITLRFGEHLTLYVFTERSPS